MEAATVLTEAQQKLIEGTLKAVNCVRAAVGAEPLDSLRKGIKGQPQACPLYNSLIDCVPLEAINDGHSFDLSTLGDERVQMGEKIDQCELVEADFDTYSDYSGADYRELNYIRWTVEEPDEFISAFDQGVFPHLYDEDNA